MAHAKLNYTQNNVIIAFVFELFVFCANCGECLETSFKLLIALHLCHYQNKIHKKQTK